MRTRSTRTTALPSPAGPLPGLRIRAVIDPARPFGRLTEPPFASFSCRCGFYREVYGVNEVQEFVTNHHKHAAVCPLNASEGDVTSGGMSVSHVADDAKGWGSVLAPKNVERPGGLIPDRSAGSRTNRFAA
jgi:hypothetical protein